MTISKEISLEISADIAVIGGGVGGCAAALAAARSGRTVVLTEETDWLGGQLTNQGVPPDEHPWIEQFGCTRSYRDFRNRVRDYYRQNYPLTQEAARRWNLNPGNGSVSRLCHEPMVALAVLQEMLEPYVAQGRVQVLLNHRPVSAEVVGDQVRSVMLRERSGEQRTLRARYFLDATELGDLLPITGTEFVIGAEGQQETGEPHAPAAPQPENHQAFTVCFAVEHRAGESHLIDRPADYAFWRDYLPELRPAWPGPLLSLTGSQPVSLRPITYEFDPLREPAGVVRGLWLYRRICDGANFSDRRGDVCLVNWPQNDYWLGNLVGVDEHEADSHIERAKQLSLSLLYWLQAEAPRSDGGVGWPGLKLRPDVMGTCDGLAKAPYIRESRRIRAEFTVCEHHVSTEARMLETGLSWDHVTATPFEDSVGVGAYRIDLHPTTGGENYLDVSSLPFQIPLGALIPSRMENLLPACKNLGVTHITNGCYRLHPVEWNIGEAAATLAAHCLDFGSSPRAVRNNPARLAEFQSRLIGDGIEIAWPELRPL